MPFGVYSIVQNFNIPIQVQPQCFMVLCLASWAQTLVYGRKWRMWTTALLTVGTGAVFGGLEAALIVTLRVSVFFFFFFSSACCCYCCPSAT